MREVRARGQLVGQGRERKKVLDFCTATSPVVEAERAFSVAATQGRLRPPHGPLSGARLCPVCDEVSERF